MILKGILGFLIAQEIEHLDPKYQVFYGERKASVHVIEYFSLSCPKCYAFFQSEFPKIQKQYIESNTICFAFHPDPADLLTLQAMVCLEALPQELKAIFLEAVIGSIIEQKGRHGCKLMQMTMEILGCPIPQLGSIDFLQTTEAFQSALRFLTQKHGIQTIPAIEIDGALCPENPTYEFLETKIKVLSST